MKTASLHDLKSDLKALFINRYLAHGFKLPIILFSGKLLVGVGALLPQTRCPLPRFAALINHRRLWVMPD